MNRETELVFFGLPPGAAHPGWWKERDVENRHDGEGKKIDDHRECVGHGAGKGADEDDQQKTGVTGGDRAKASLLNLGPAA